jgi:hypothetical protein
VYKHAPHALRFSALRAVRGAETVVVAGSGNELDSCDAEAWEELSCTSTLARRPTDTAADAERGGALVPALVTTPKGLP